MNTDELTPSNSFTAGVLAYFSRLTVGVSCSGNRIFVGGRVDKSRESIDTILDDTRVTDAFRHVNLVNTKQPLSHVDTIVSTDRFAGRKARVFSVVGNLDSHMVTR